MNKAIDNTYKASKDTQVIYLAGGCFWGIEKLVQMIDGVIDGTSGYANGIITNPTYQDVLKGDTKFVETVRVEYDPKIVKLETILKAYYSVIDVRLKNRQGNDIGTQYQTGIFYVDDESRKIVEEISNKIKENEDVFNVIIKPLDNFYKAEEYHQNYLDKNPRGYCHIGQDEFEKVQQIIESAKKLIDFERL